MTTASSSVRTPLCIAVTGASGSQQSAVVRAALKAGHTVRAFARKPPADPTPGVTWIAGDLQDPGALHTLLQGADAASVHLPVAAGPFDTTALVDALAAASLRRVVFNAGSALPPEGAPASPARLFADALSARGLDVVTLQPTLYLENLLLPNVQAGLKTGVLRYPLPAAGFGVSWVATADLGSLAVRALQAEATGAFHAAGPAALDGHALAVALSAGLGRSVTFEAITPAAFGAALTPILGADAAATVQGLYAGIEAAPAQFEGWLSPGAEAAAHVQSAFGHTATAAADWAGAVLKGVLGAA